MTDPAALPPDVRARLEELRHRIDAADVEFVELLARRADLVLKAAALKTEAGLPLLDADREEAIRTNLRAAAGHRLPSAEFDQLLDAVRRLMRRVVGAS